jgi:hypothetical protein
LCCLSLRVPHIPFFHSFNQNDGSPMITVKRASPNFLANDATALFFMTAIEQSPELPSLKFSLAARLDELKSDPVYAMAFRWCATHNKYPYVSKHRNMAIWTRGTWGKPGPHFSLPPLIFDLIPGSWKGKIRDRTPFTSYLAVAGALRMIHEVIEFRTF